MVNWNPEWDKREDTHQSGPAAENQSVVEYLDGLGRNMPTRRVVGSMRYPVAFQSFTTNHPAIGSAVIGVAFFAIMFVLVAAAGQGRHEVLVLIVSVSLAVLVFAGNWFGARYSRTHRSRDQRHPDG